MNDQFLPGPIAAGFAVATLAVVLVGLLGLRAIRLQAASAEQVTHTMQVRAQSEALLSAIVDAETGQRGYLLTHDENYLAPYERGRTDAGGELASLRALTADNPAQQSRLNALQEMIDGKLKELAQTVELARQGRNDDAIELVRTNRGKNTMDRVRELLSAVKQTEQEILAARTLAWERSSVFSTYVIAGGSALLVFFIFVSANLTSRDYRARTRSSWLKTGQSELAAQMAGDRSIDELTQAVLQFLAKYLGAHVGALYTVESDSSLRRAAAYAFSAEPSASRDRFGKNQGLVGQAAAEDRILELVNVPSSYLRVSSAVGDHAPFQVVVAPARVDGRVNGVVELGFFHRVRRWERELLELVAEPIGVAMRSALDRARLEALLEETQRQSEELQTQQEELRVTNEELEEQGNVLRESQARLEGQQTELEQINAQLEEQQQALVHAQSDLTAKAEELERASRYKSEFLANMSHELRTPLNSALILSKLLMENKTGNLTGEQVTFAGNIFSAGSDLLNLINDILDLSKIEAGKIEIVTAPVEIARVTESLRQLAQPLAEDKHLALSISIDPRVPKSIHTDSQRLQQILINLLSNAVKFTARGEVALAVNLLPDDFVAFSVRDTGIGVPSEQHAAIFEAFRQADGNTNRKYGGTGLGLSISKELARLLGGRIELDSTPGQGSTFTLIVPKQLSAAMRDERPALAAVKRSSAARAHTPAPMDDRADLAKSERVLLVVEDDPTFAKILYDLAGELNYRCLIATTADEGMALALKHKPAAVILDIRLPDHTGLTVLDRLKHHSATRHIPVQIVSAVESSQTALEMGAAGYMLKPVNREQLAEAISRLESKLSKQPRTVLVVEDSAIQRESICQLLTSENVRTIAVDTAAAALEQLRQTTFDCMVMDLSLPDSSGYELLEKMAGEEQYSFPAVIVYTARSLLPEEEQRLRKYSKSIIIKGAKSPERLLDEVTLFLHQVEASLPPERQRQLRQARDRDAPFEGRRILLVEDDVRNIFALSRVLEPQGAKLAIARNGKEALAALEREPKIDIVLMDIMMPEMDGYQAMREIRARPLWSRLPIIALTARAMPDDQQLCLAAGANDYIAKPIDVEKLLSLIRIWMPG